MFTHAGEKMKWLH